MADALRRPVGFHVDIAEDEKVLILVWTYGDGSIVEIPVGRADLETTRDALSEALADPRVKSWPGPIPN
jgi:hypothetical protein